MNTYKITLVIVAVSFLFAIAQLRAVGSPSSPTTAEQSKSEHKPELSAKSPAAGEKISRQVLSAAGSYGGNGTYYLSGTAGQIVAGNGCLTTNLLYQGYWSGGGPVSCNSCTNCGDANSDGNINISDAVFLIQYIFAGGAAPTPLCKGDASGDGTVNISDAVYLIQYIFSGGPAPHCP